MAPYAQGLETGVPAIDAGNDGLRYLLGRVFEPGVECRRGQGDGQCDRKHCIRLQAIIRYMDRNFAHQERVMAEADYPEADRHCGDHARLVDKLHIMVRGQVCADRDGQKVRDFISHWAVEHAKRCDHPFGKWAVTRRVLDPKR